MTRVFISHSSRDKSGAKKIKDWLRQQGFDTPFLDFDKNAGIPPGADWERTLYRELDRSEAMIIIQTPNWLESKWCFAEYAQARALGKPIFPVIMGATGNDRIASDIQALNLLDDREAGLRQLASELRRIALDSHRGFEWDATRAPYPGLLAFQEEDAPIYFGRDDDIRRLIERLNMRRTLGGARLIWLLGASGSGKSSLMRAGVIPRLRRATREWIILPTIRPQAHPMAELARSLAIAAGRDWRELAVALAGRSCGRELHDLASDLRLKAGANEAQILLPLDQAEELFGASDPDEAERFLEVVSTALEPDRPFLAVMAMRSDFLGHLQSAAALTARFEEFSLKPMSLARIPQIIEGPARVAGISVDEGFVQQAARDAETEDALPLLAFALRELYDRMGVDDHLSLSDYHALGDAAAGLTPLGNAVRQAADSVISEMRPDAATLNALRDAFVPAMVRVNEHGEYVRRPARWVDLPARAHELLERLAASRLLVISQVGETRMVEVAHEALLRKWPRLRRWLDEAREFLAARQQLELDLRDWQSADAADKRKALLTGLKLGRARSWLSERPQQLTEAERAFIKASADHAEAEEQRRREEQERRVRDAEALAEANRRTAQRTRTGLTIASLFAATAIIAGFFAYGQQIKAEAQAIRADQQRQDAEHARAEAEQQRAEAERQSAKAMRQTAEADRQRDKAQFRLSQYHTTLAERENARGNHTNAILVSIAALEQVKPEQRDRLNYTKKQLYDGLSKLQERRVLAGHTDRVTFAAFDTSGARLVTASHDGTARIWEVATGETHTILSGHGKRVTHAAFSPDGRFVATASEDGTARTWDAHTGAARHVLRIPDPKWQVYYVAFSPDSARLVAAAYKNDPMLWDVKTGNLISQLTGQGYHLVVHAKFSPDGNRILTSDREEGLGRLWDGRTGEHLMDLEGHESGHYYVSFSPDGTRVLTASADGTARIWDVMDGRELAKLQGHTGKVFHAAYNHDGTLIVTASEDGTTRVWTGDGDYLRELKGHSDAVRHAAFVPLSAANRPQTGPPEDRIITVGRDDLALVWDARTGNRIGTLAGHQDDVTHVAISPDGQWVATTGDRTARLWTLENNAFVQVLRGHEDAVRNVAFSPDGSRLLSSPGGWWGKDNDWVFLWDTQTGLEVASFNAPDMQDAAFSPDGRWLAVAARDKILLAHGRTGDVVRAFENAEGLPNRIAFSPDSRKLAAAYPMPELLKGTRIWEVGTGKQIATIVQQSEQHSDFAWSPDGGRILVEGAVLWDIAARRSDARLERSGSHQYRHLSEFSPDGKLALTVRAKVARLWDMESGGLSRTLEGHTDRLLSARFSNDGTRVLTTSADKTARLWDASSGQELLVFKGHADQVNHGAFSPDDRLIVTGAGRRSAYDRLYNEDNRALVWDAQNGDVVAELDGHSRQVNRVAFSPDGRLVATASEDRTVRLWRLMTDPEELIEYAKTIVPRELTSTERNRFGLDDTDQ